MVCIQIFSTELNAVELLCVHVYASAWMFFFFLWGGESIFFLLKDNQPDPLMRCLTYTYNLYIKIKQNPASVILYLTAHFFLFFFHAFHVQVKYTQTFKRTRAWGDVEPSVHCSWTLQQGWHERSESSGYSHKRMSSQWSGANLVVWQSESSFREFSFS